MCDCATCGAYVRCDNPGCTNSECPDCSDAREARNYDPPDIDGEDLCRDYAAERRDAQLAAREVKR